MRSWSCKRHTQNCRGVLKLGVLLVVIASFHFQLMRLWIKTIAQKYCINTRIWTPAFYTRKECNNHLCSCPTFTTHPILTIGRLKYNLYDICFHLLCQERKEILYSYVILRKGQKTEGKYFQMPCEFRHFCAKLFITFHICSIHEEGNISTALGIGLVKFSDCRECQDLQDFTGSFSVILSLGTFFLSLSYSWVCLILRSNRSN